MLAFPWAVKQLRSFQRQREGPAFPTLRLSLLADALNWLSIHPVLAEAPEPGTSKYAKSLSEKGNYKTMSTRKSPLVLIPGLLCDAQLWRHQVENLSDISDIWIADHTRSATLAGVARDVLADAPLASFALAGLSMGGYIAFEIMRQAPQRVSRLALLDTAAGAELPEQKKGRLEFIAQAERGEFSQITKALLPLFLHPARLAEPALVGIVESMAKNTGKDAFVRQEKAIMSRADSRRLLREIHCPTLVLCGRQDALTPLARHEEIAAGIAGARLEVIEDCGHLSTLEKPAEVNAALRRWLAA
jgi:pimeloyl-ACP methyl ester carboxylesterase